MRSTRHAVAGLLILLCAGCASSADEGSSAPPAPAAASSAPTAAPAAPSPSPAAPGTVALLDSQPATLDALRAEQARRPVSVLVPGRSTPSPVAATTTDPVSGGLALVNNAATVVWWSSGTAPGSPSGSVVLAAHVSYQGETGPFTRLASVAPGAEVTVTSADGSTRRYAVTGTRYAPKTSLDRAELFRTTGPPTLALVTCGGAYDRATRSYADNVVVSAVPV